MKTLYMSWQDPNDRSWHPVGKLSFNGEVYRFVYTRGAKKCPNFIPFARMLDLDTAYKSKELFPLFANRLVSKTRPEYKNLLQWLNIRRDEDDPLSVLARTGGKRETDPLTLFLCPEKKDDDTYHMHFFSHGIRYLPDQTIQFIDNLSPGTRLFLMPDSQNPYDAYALALRTDDPVMIVGYCPRYLSSDSLYLLKEGPDTPKVLVEQVNHDAPIQLRLLCSLTAPWAKRFQPCSGGDYEVLA